MSLKFKLFANCIPVKGYCRSVINDLQRNSYKYVPNSLYYLLKKHDGESLDEIKIQNPNYEEIIDEYFEFLKLNEFGFFTFEPHNFPELDLIFDLPSKITNAEISEQIHFQNYKQICNELNVLNCKAIQLRLFSSISIKKIETILDAFKNSRIQYIEIIFQYQKDIILDDLKKMAFENQRIWVIRIHNSPFKKIEFLDKQKHHPVFYSTSIITDHSFCGFIHPKNFVQNIPFFTESLHLNTCLNRKVCIDENGFIKNCLSMDKHYGNMNEVDLKEVVQSEEFQKLWHIKKDDIKVCKDCEFRHMCMDCRAFIKDPNDIYSQPAKCPYNPYIAKWKGEEGYITVEEWQKQQKESTT